MPDPLAVLALGAAGLFLLIALHVPVGAAMLIAGVGGFALLNSPGAAFSTVAVETASVLSSPDLATIPLFLLMGGLASRAGMSSDIYDLARSAVGHLRGGLAMSTILTCAGFGALSGSSLATTATMARVALPEMTARGYAPSLAAGAIAGGGSLGILIPPSIIMVVYAVLTEQFVLDLFIAGILPGLLSVALYCAAISVVVRLRPAAGPAFRRAAAAELGRSALRAWRALVTVVLVIGGIYGGIFTVVEAASFGAVVVLGFLFARRGRDAWPELLDTCREVAGTTAMIFLMVIGANVLNYFLTLSGATREIVHLISGSGLSDYTILLLILLMYLVLGAVFETVAAMVLTLPFVFPLILDMGLDPVWWGIMNVMMIEIGLITPPIGLNVFVIKGIARDLSYATIYRGIVPFFLADILRVLIVLSFPQIALVLL